MTGLELCLAASAALLAPLTANALANGATFRALPSSPPPRGGRTTHRRMRPVGVTAAWRGRSFPHPSGPSPITPTSASCGAVSSPVEGEEGISLLVPARNEAGRLGPLLESVRALDGPFELLVYDDDSTDGTDRLVLAHAAADPRIRLVRGGPLPEGWSGKVHALHRLAQEARGRYLLFLDADVTLLPGALERAVATLEAEGLDILSLYPQQILATWGEKIFVPCMVYYFHLLGSQWALRRGARPPAVALNGQFMLWRREAYQAIGGYESIKSAWLDDMTIARMAVASGLSVSYRPGRGLARCRMYTGFASAWQGFAKHTWDSFSQPAPVYLLLHAWLFWSLVAPWALLAAAPWLPVTPLAVGLWAAIAGMTAATRVLSCYQAGGGWWSALAHPLAMAGAIANGVHSWLLSRNRTSAWKGRTRGDLLAYEESPHAPSL